MKKEVDRSRRTLLTAIVAGAALAPLAKANAQEAHKWGMIVDLNRCFGCQSCTLACRSALPLKGLWRTKILEKEIGLRPTFTPMLCQQCPMPDCVPVCPENALIRDASGIVRVVSERCVGCGQCVSACRYGMISLFEKKAYKCELCTESEMGPPCVESCASHARLFGDFLHPTGDFAKALQDPTLAPIEGSPTEAVIFYIPLVEGGAVCKTGDARL